MSDKKDIEFVIIEVHTKKEKIVQMIGHRIKGNSAKDALYGYFFQIDLDSSEEEIKEDVEKNTVMVKSPVANRNDWHAVYTDSEKVDDTEVIVYCSKEDVIA